MWIEDLTKALYFLNVTDYKYSICIDKIENNRIYFSNHTSISINDLMDCYNHYIKTGELTKLW